MGGVNGDQYPCKQYLEIKPTYFGAYSGYCAPQGEFFMGAKLFIMSPLVRNEVIIKKLFRLCENTLFSWQSLADIRMGVECLQN